MSQQCIALCVMVDARERERAARKIARMMNTQDPENEYADDVASMMFAADVQGWYFPEPDVHHVHDSDEEPQVLVRPADLQALWDAARFALQVELGLLTPDHTTHVDLKRQVQALHEIRNRIIHLLADDHDDESWRATLAQVEILAT